MKDFFNRCLWLWVGVVFVFLLTGCAGPRTYHWTEQISDSLLDQDPIYKSYKVQPADLSLRSKCNAPPSVKIITNESRTDDYEIYKARRGDTAFINLKKTMDGASLYLKNGFEKSHIKVDEQSAKVLQLRMVDVGLQYTPGQWSIRGYVKMELIIPEKNFSKIYEAKEDTGSLLWVALVYAIHNATRQIIDDPVIQDYILCR